MGVGWSYSINVQIVQKVQMVQNVLNDLNSLNVLNCGFLLQASCLAHSPAGLVAESGFNSILSAGTRLLES
jgi:hypothetical protein